MKKYKIALVALALFIVLACVYPVSADVLSDYTTDYDESSQKVHVVVTLSGGEEGARASEYPRDFVILVDTSLSMRDVYKGKTRLEWAKNATIDFLESLHAYNSRVGVVSFSNEAKEVCPLDFNFEGVKRGIENVSSHGFSTNYGEGIQKAALVLERRERESLPIIILLADGGEDKGATSIEDAVDFAKKEGIVIYVVSFGDREWIDEVMLRKAAEETGGEYRYTSFEGLSDALIKITKMEEFLSAANLRILISQSDDAVLDHLSIEEMVSPGVVLSRKGYFEFVSPKLTPEKKIELEFDAFSVKEGNVTAGIIDVYYTGKDGGKEKESVMVEGTISKPKQMSAVPFMILNIMVGVIAIFLGIMYLRFKMKIKNVIRGMRGIIEGSRSRRVEEVEESLVSQLRKIGGSKK